MSFIQRLSSKDKNDWSRILYALYKDARYSVAPSRQAKTVVLILGCQRSGSTMMYNIFCKDHRSKVFQEFSKLSSDDTENKIRLNSKQKLERQIESLGHPVVVLKPLVESQHTDMLLSIGENTKGIWLYRHYKDVAASNLKKFGAENGKKNIKPIIAGESDNWRSEKVSSAVREQIKNLVSSDLSNLDYAALFWWARNMLYFEQRLYNIPLIYTCNYSNLVSSPLEETQKIYAFLDIDHPGEKIVKHVHSNSIGKGNKAQLSNSVENLCSDLYKKLEDCTS